MVTRSPATAWAVRVIDPRAASPGVSEITIWPTAEAPNAAPATSSVTGAAPGPVKPLISIVIRGTSPIVSGKVKINGPPASSVEPLTTTPLTPANPLKAASMFSSVSSWLIGAVVSPLKLNVKVPAVVDASGVMDCTS